MFHIRIFFIFLFLFTLNCSANKVSNNHGYISLQGKFDKITINKTNKNDILKIIGPPSSTSNFDKNKWFYIQTKKENQSLFKLGIKKIEKNNVLVVIFNNKGILEEKKMLNMLKMLLKKNINKTILFIKFYQACVKKLMHQLETDQKNNIEFILL